MRPVQVKRKERRKTYNKEMKFLCGYMGLDVFYDSVKNIYTERKTFQPNHEVQMAERLM